MTVETSDRNERIFFERACGDELATIADRYGISAERVRQVYEVERRARVPGIDAALRIARDENSPYLVPPVPDAIKEDEDDRMALTFKWVRWLLTELSRRGRDVEVHYGMRADAGVTFALEDVTHVRQQHDQRGTK